MDTVVFGNFPRAQSAIVLCLLSLVVGSRLHPPIREDRDIPPIPARGCFRSVLASCTPIFTGSLAQVSHGNVSGGYKVYPCVLYPCLFVASPNKHVYLRTISLRVHGWVLEFWRSRE